MLELVNDIPVPLQHSCSTPAVSFQCPTAVIARLCSKMQAIHLFPLSCRPQGVVQCNSQCLECPPVIHHA